MAIFLTLAIGIALCFLIVVFFYAVRLSIQTRHPDQGSAALVIHRWAYRSAWLSIVTLAVYIGLIILAIMGLMDGGTEAESLSGLARIKDLLELGGLLAVSVVLIIAAIAIGTSSVSDKDIQTLSTPFCIAVGLFFLTVAVSLFLASLRHRRRKNETHTLIQEVKHVATENQHYEAAAAAEEEEKEHQTTTSKPHRGWQKRYMGLLRRKAGKAATRFFADNEE